MKTKNKILLLNLIVLSAITTAVISLFTPVIIWDYSEVLENNDIEDSKLYLKIDHSSLLLTHYSVYDYRNIDHPSEYHAYRLWGFTIFASGDHELKNEFIGVTDYDIENSGFFSQSVLTMLSIVIPIIWLFLLIYFCYKGLRFYNQNKIRYFLYAGFITLIMLIVLIIGIYSLFNYIDINNLGFTSGLSFGYGFYILILSIVLFFTVFILQNYFLDRTEKT